MSVWQTPSMVNVWSRARYNGTSEDQEEKLKNDECVERAGWLMGWFTLTSREKAVAKARIWCYWS